jgi:hypothetical protein
MSSASEYYGYLLSKGYKGYSDNQWKEFEQLGSMVNNGEISLNKSYRLACKSGFSNMTMEQAQDGCEEIYESDGAEAFNKCVEQKMSKKGFKDWANTAKENGWIDKGLDIFSNLYKPNDSGGGGQNTTTYQKEDNTIAYVMVGVVGLASIGAVIYLISKKG